MRLKNVSVITLLFVVPIVAYMILSHSHASFAVKTSAAKPQIIKFTSLMCLDCKKLNKVLKEVYPKYSNKIALTEVQVQDESASTKKMIQKYNVTLVPTLITIDSKGKVVQKVEGFVDKPQLDSMMQKLK